LSYRDLPWLRSPAGGSAGARPPTPPPWRSGGCGALSA
jgi:hypothetical protein